MLKATPTVVLTDYVCFYQCSNPRCLPACPGLTRTCEIFQASQLVMDDLSVAETLEFKTISRTAEKWTPLVEVRSASIVSLISFAAVMREPTFYWLGK